MSDLLEPVVATSRRPALPTPTRARWQPLRIGLVELFRYDSEEFWFHDGHLLLRGNNGAGKSKVLALTLPFLFDAQLKPARLEPDGDSGKRMTWNLLLETYDRRTGYAWIELGRVAEDGAPRYLTLGAGLSAVAGRPHIDSWFFVVDEATDGPRLGEDLWLISRQQVVLTKERLREALEDRGRVFDTATAYRRAVDERLFHLGTNRYSALMDTLIQLRQPQLSKKPDEAGLSNALTEALPPLAADLLGDVADALNHLEEDRRQLEEHEALERNVTQFYERYRIYAGTQSRRQARNLRQAQTEFDNASRAVNEARGQLEAARQDEARKQGALEQAKLELASRRARLKTLQSHPTMQDANRLEGAANDVAARQRALQAAESLLNEAADRVSRAVNETEQYAGRAARIERALDERRRDAAARASAVGVAGPLAANPIVAHTPLQLVDLAARGFETACSELRAIAGRRRDEIAIIWRHLSTLTTVEGVHSQRRQTRDDRQEDARLAAERRSKADDDVDQAGQVLFEAWDRHFSGLRQLRVISDIALAGLADWVVTAIGDNPAKVALHGAQQEAVVRLAARRVELEQRRQALDAERADLIDERRRLESGEHAFPLVPHTRDPTSRADRAGAPLWQLLEFATEVDDGQRAGLEAALEASGLLDAWVAPDGSLQAADGGTLPLDTQIVKRAAQRVSVGAWLRPADGSSVPSDIVEQVLNGIASGPQDPLDVEAWVSPNGRFRLGALTGAWTKPMAVYIGFAARAAARAQRLTEIAQRLAELSRADAVFARELAEHTEAEEHALEDWRSAPSDDALRAAHLAAGSCAREVATAQERLEQAAAQFREAEETLRAARHRLAADAADLRLPDTVDALHAFESEIGHFDDTQRSLVEAVREMRLVAPELKRQRDREAEAREARDQAERRLIGCRLEAREASARWEALRDSVGAKVEELQRRLSAADTAVDEAEAAWEKAEGASRAAGETRAVADTQATIAERTLRECSELRAQAVVRLQSFAATGLLPAALPTLDIPDQRTAWTIDPALSLARRAEQALAEISDSDEAWSRIQGRIAEDFGDLQRALTALGQQAQAETSDYGLAVTIMYQNRPERPDQLAKRLAEEIAQRRELLSANEREILENHLQAEIATEVQRLLRAAEHQVEGINRELHKRPTSTGMRYRLQWLPIAEGAEGAPVGLDAARKRLLNTSADLWSAEDRRIVGAMLQQRIAAERERADAAGGGSLLDQLARALDYRRWHEFKVQRLQDGEWRKLSGPASSGERALGLTVPLFAAVASFYSQTSYANAPRLVLLDEAFAGIDAAARAHCMGLIREFDLDFAITSESEWACYAELPGVSICHLQRREGVDAVFVSRWTWDGRARRREEDPDRRFAPS
jgi:uncharacterized protein (TIGR02680 family)